MVDISDSAFVPVHCRQCGKPTPQNDLNAGRCHMCVVGNQITQLMETANNTGVKYDSGKPPLHLIPRSALEVESRVMGFGADKYGRDNWRGGMEWTRLIGAALRHITAFNEGEDNDPESGLSHLGHARCCLAFLSEYVDKHLGVDDRAGKGGGQS